MSKKNKDTNLKNLPKVQILEFWNKHYTWHTIWSRLIRCVNMKWIQWILLKILWGHDSVHRRTDGRTDGQTVGVKPLYSPSTSLSRGYNNRYCAYFRWYTVYPCLLFVVLFFHTNSFASERCIYNCKSIIAIHIKAVKWPSSACQKTSIRD